MILAKGRPVVLTRPYDAAPPAPLTVMAFLGLYSPQQVNPPITQGDGRLAILNDEIAAAAWPAPIETTVATIDGVAWTVLGAERIFDGPLLIGWSLWVRGGQP